jgi:hypothetical protein
MEAHGSRFAYSSKEASVLVFSQKVGMLDAHPALRALNSSMSRNSGHPACHSQTKKRQSITPHDN